LPHSVLTALGQVITMSHVEYQNSFHLVTLLFSPVPVFSIAAKGIISSLSPLLKSLEWQCLLVIPVLRRLRQEDHI
jgi:hypothetical protein